MLTKSLSPREAEIVQLSTEGLTNDAIAIRMGVSLGTVNTYWSRIKVKTGGLSRTDAVAKVIGNRGEQALREADTDHSGIERVLQAGMDMLLREREDGMFHLRAAVGMIQVAVDQMQATMWATDTDFRIQVISGPQGSRKLPLALGKTMYEVFGTHNRSHPGVASLLGAIEGQDSAARLGGGENGIFMRVSPLRDESGQIIGCIGLFSSIELTQDQATASVELGEHGEGSGVYNPKPSLVEGSSLI